MVASQRYQYFRRILRNPKYLRASWPSIITTNGINFLMAGPFSWDDGNFDANLDGKFDGNSDGNLMGILMMDSKGWPYASFDCLLFHQVSDIFVKLVGVGTVDIRPSID